MPKNQTIDRINKVLDEILHLRPWPPVALRVLKLSRLPDVGPTELVTVLQTDAAFTAQVLRLCNSAYYGFQREVTSLAEAGNRLGTTTLVNLVLTSCVGESFCGTSQEPGQRPRKLWEHSIMNALGTSWLASIHGGVDRNVAYTAGLLQNIGCSVLDSHLQTLRPEILELRANGMDALQAERAVVGLDHAQIGGRLLRRWGFPDVLVDAVESHHAPEKASVDPVLTSLVHLGGSLTDAIALGEGLENLAYTLSDRALGLTGLTVEKLGRMEEALMLELTRARDLVQAA